MQVPLILEPATWTHSWESFVPHSRWACAPCIGAAAALQRHRRRVAVAVSVLLAGTALTAFGIAPMAPDAAQLPRRQITETIEPAGSAGPTAGARFVRHGAVARRPDARQRQRREPVAPTRRVRSAAGHFHARQQRHARALFEGRPGKQVQARVEQRRTAARARGPLRAAQRIEQANTHFTRLTIARSGDQWRADSELAALDTQVRRRWRHDPDVAVRGHRRSPAARPDRDPDGRDLLGRHRLSPRTASRRHLQRRLRVPQRRRRAGHLGRRGAGRVLAAEFVNGGQGTTGAVVRRGQRQGRLLRLRRPEPAPHLPRQPDGVLARDLGLLDAHAPDPATPGASTAASTTPRPPARRCARWATAGFNSPAGRTATATWCRSRTATTSRPCTPT